MKYDIYGKFQLEVRRENDAWTVYRLGSGVRSRTHDVVLPDDLEPGEIAIFLDDLFHESDTDGRGIEELR
jgi:hypothetical protein